MAAKWVFLPVSGRRSRMRRAQVGPAARADRAGRGGRKLRGRRLFGDNKTWRGVLHDRGPDARGDRPAPAGPGTAHGLAEIRDAPPALVGALLGLGVFGGELPNSFLKRQLDIPPGGQRRDAVGI